MLNKIHRNKLKKYQAPEIDALVQRALQHICAHSQPEDVFLIGSALTDHFDNWSDLDFVIVYPDKEKARMARKNLYRNPSQIGRPVDYICLDKETFNRKSQIGGICFIAVNEGRKIA